MDCARFGAKGFQAPATRAEAEAEGGRAEARAQIVAEESGVEAVKIVTEFAPGVRPFLLLPPAGQNLATGAANANGGGSTRRHGQTDAELDAFLNDGAGPLRRYGEWFALAWAHFGDACAYCQGLSRAAGASSWGYTLKTFDHFIPPSRGGCEARHNLIPACHYCNSMKSNRDALTWYRAQPFHSPAREARILAYMLAVWAWDSADTGDIPDTLLSEVFA